jgi:hypothetical protein
MREGLEILMRGLKYITTPLIETTSAVCELKVFEPVVAKSCHADQDPDKLEAVQYIFSFGAVVMRQPRVKEFRRLYIHHPLS